MLPGVDKMNEKMSEDNEKNIDTLNNKIGNNIEDLAKDKTCISGTIGGKTDSSNIANKDKL